jgi:hypothetical protein
MIDESRVIDLIQRCHEQILPGEGIGTVVIHGHAYTIAEEVRNEAQQRERAGYEPLAAIFAALNNWSARRPRMKPAVCVCPAWDMLRDGWACTCGAAKG